MLCNDHCVTRLSYLVPFSPFFSFLDRTHPTTIFYFQRFHFHLPIALGQSSSGEITIGRVHAKVCCQRFMECCGNNENNCKAVFAKETRSKRSDLLFIRKVMRLNDATNRENGFVANGDMYILKTQRNATSLKYVEV